MRDKADAVVVVIHSGLGERVELRHGRDRRCRARTSVRASPARCLASNLIVIGHSHREIADTVINGVTIVQPRNWATSVALATLALARRAGAWQVTGTRGVLVREAGHAEDARGARRHTDGRTTRRCAG